MQSRNILILDRNFNQRRKSISSTGKYMLVQFLTDNEATFKGFRAFFHYVPNEKNCAKLNKTTQHFEFPN